MKERKTFSKTATREDYLSWCLQQWRGNKGAGGLRVTVEGVKADPVEAMAPLLQDLELTEAAEAVARFVDYRRDDKGNPIKSIKALRWILTRFAGRPAALTRSIDLSIEQNYVGLFEKANSNSRNITTEVAENVGQW